MIEQVLGLRPFVPARDFSLSQRFYQALDCARAAHRVRTSGIGAVDDPALRTMTPGD